MKVAIDVRKLHDFGIGTYIRNILRHLSRVDRENEYVLLCQDADLAPELVANRAELDRFIEAVVAEEDLAQLPLGQGWRRELLGDALVRLIHGEVSLSLNRSAPFLRLDERR